ncbi:MAG: hypothetical protein H8D55_00130, partial [Deltaproteobacteria bacterium]|nr:hypothetical protein [Deltaproteobacteria bacterium]
MEQMKLLRASFFCMLAFAFLFMGGCAGSQPKEMEEKVARSAKTVVGAKSQGVAKDALVPAPSVIAEQRIAQQPVDTTGSIRKGTPEGLPTVEKQVARMVPAALNAQPTLPVLKPTQALGTTADSEKKGPKIVLNFDNADLYAVINTIGELLGINYIVGPNVAGKVTINTAGGLYKKDLFPIFLKILEVNGLTAIKEGNLYKIVETKDSPRMPLDLRLSAGGEDVPPMDKIVIQIIPLKFISTGEMATLITPFMSKGGTIVSDANSNTLIVIDKWLNILKALRLIGTFDVNIFDKVKYRFYPLEYLDAEEVVAFLTDFTSYYEKATNVF